VTALLLLFNAPILSLLSLRIALRLDLIILLLWPAFLLLFTFTQCFFANRLYYLPLAALLNILALSLAVFAMIQLGGHLESKLSNGLCWLLAQVQLAGATGLFLAWQTYSKRCHSPS
jgi:hypothetical protein